MFDDVRIETERLIIRPFVAEDAEQLAKVLGREEVTRYLPEDVMTLDEVRRTIAWLVDRYSENTPEHVVKWTLAATWKRTGEIIGWCGLGPLDFRSGEIELFYGLSPEYWGKGIATEAARAILRYGFAVIGLERIVAVTHPENAASVRVIEKLRMTFEKTVTELPEEHRWYEGCRYYSLSRTDALRLPG